MDSGSDPCWLPSSECAACGGLLFVGPLSWRPVRPFLSFASAQGLGDMAKAVGTVAVACVLASRSVLKCNLLGVGPVSLVSPRCLVLVVPSLGFLACSTSCSSGGVLDPGAWEDREASCDACSVCLRKSSVSGVEV